MVDPIVTGLAGFLGGIVVSPLLFAGMTALYQMTQALDQDVDEEGDG